MYDLPAVKAATNAWWGGLARAFRREGIAGVPDMLSRGPSVRDLWTDRQLLFSQTCGYPLIHELRDQVALVATPCYSAPGCSGADYCSVIIVPVDSEAKELGDLRGKTCAVNRRDSHSGYNVLRALIAPLALGERFFQSVTITGNHPSSLRLVADGAADVAAIDCVTYALLARDEPETVARTRILCLTPPAPGLPYVTARRAPDDLVKRLRNGLQSAFDDPDLYESREALLLSGFQVLPLSEYQRIAAMRAGAVARGYPNLA